MPKIFPPDNGFCFMDCEHLSITEDQQDCKKGGKEPHICKLYNDRVYHFADHPKLHKLRKCNYKQ